MGYKGLNEISQDVSDRAQNLVFVVKVLDLEGETVTRGSPYKFAMLNCLERSHLENNFISPIDETNSTQTHGIGNEIDKDTIVQIFRHIGIVLSYIPQKKYQELL